jgi:hypothetical protein
MKIELPYNPPLSKKEVLEELSKYRKLNYNKFKWWRMYDYWNQPLSVKRDIKDRIRNGDFERSVFAPQVWLVEHELNELFESCKDVEDYREKSTLSIARRDRLIEELFADEEKRLKALYDALRKIFDIDKEEIEKEALNCEGEIVDLYIQIAQKYNRK